MKKVAIYLLLFFLCAAVYGVEGEFRYTVIKNPYTFSTYFEMIRANGYEGRAVKKALSVHTTYKLYDSHGAYTGKGVCRILSLGALYSWAKDLDLYDEHDNKIGFIDGLTLTTAKAKFDIYNSVGHKVAVAYYNKEKSGFSLMSADGLEHMLGYLKRNNVVNQSDDWEVLLYEPKVMDLRILKIFSAFVVDHQDHF